MGVIKVLRREGLQFDLVVGTSIGSLLGAVYCLDIPTDEIEALALRTTANDLLDITISRMGLTEGNRLESVIRQAVKNKTFADMKTPLAVVTVDIETGEEVCFQDGDLIKVIKASCSLPGIYKPVEINARFLIDGGLRKHLPTAIAKKLGADFVAAVDVGFCIKKGRLTSMLAVIMQSIQIMGEEMSLFQSSEADILIKPRLGDEIDQLAFNKAAIIIKKGEEAAEEALPLLKRHLRGR